MSGYPGGCGIGRPAVELPDAGGGLCCAGAAMFGPERCTCWKPVHDLDQADPQPGPQVPRAARCGDCAYLAGSPERRGEDGYQANTDELDRLVAEGQPFQCHQGLRRVVRWEHQAAECEPTGAVIDGHPADYDPPIDRQGVAYKADGSPADLCAGWHLRRQRELRLQAEGASS